MFIIAIINKDTKEINCFDLDKKKVAFGDKSAILSFYQANKIHHELSKTVDKDIKLINLFEFLMNHKDLVEHLKDRIIKEFK